MFNSDLIIPKEIRGGETMGLTKRSIFDLSLSNDELNEEKEILMKCQKDQFYGLLKNEPYRYLGIIIKEDEIACHLHDKFQFSIKQSDQKIIIELSVKDEYPICLESDPTSIRSEEELVEVLQQYINAKWKEQNNLMPKVKKYSDQRKTLNKDVKSTVLNNLEQIEQLVQKTRELLKRLECK